VGANSRCQLSIGKVLANRQSPSTGNFSHVVQPYICSGTEFKRISAEKFVVHRSDPWERKNVLYFKKIFSSHMQGMGIRKYMCGLWGSCPTVELLGHDADHQLPPSTGFKA